MLSEFLYGKIHRATVTEANLEYVGSITIDKSLLIASGIKNFQTSLVWKDVKSSYWTLAVLFSMIIIIAGIIILINTTLALKIVGIIILVYALLDILTRLIFMKKIKNYVKD